MSKDIFSLFAIMLLITTMLLATGLNPVSAEIQENPGQETIKKRLEYATTTMFKELPK